MRKTQAAIAVLKMEGCHEPRNMGNLIEAGKGENMDSSQSFQKGTQLYYTLILA